MYQTRLQSSGREPIFVSSLFGVVHFLSHPFLLLLPELAAGTCYNGSHELHSLQSSEKKGSNLLSGHLGVPFCRGTWVFPFVEVGCRCPGRGGLSVALRACPFSAMGGARTHAHPTRIPRTKPGLGEREPTRNSHARTSPKPGFPPRAVHRSSNARTSPKPGCTPRASHARPTLPTHPLSPP